MSLVRKHEHQRLPGGGAGLDSVNVPSARLSPKYAIFTLPSILLGSLVQLECKENTIGLSLAAASREGKLLSF